VIQLSGEEDVEMEIKDEIDLEHKKQALADLLRIDQSEISICSTRIDDLATFQAKRMLWLVGTEAEVNAGIRGYFQHNLGDLDSAFIGKAAKLSAIDAQVVDRLCAIMDPDVETDILNEALLCIASECGDVNALIDAAVVDVDRARFLSMDGRETAFGDYLIYKFREGQCSDYDHQ
jgi:2C-methyl-D-erythritol 2,4-cyclodiphosphate synthase